MSGYFSTGSEVSAITPNATMNTLMTIESKGLSINVLTVITSCLLEKTKIDLVTVLKVYKSEPMLYVFGTNQCYGIASIGTVLSIKPMRLSSERLLTPVYSNKEASS